MTADAIASDTSIRLDAEIVRRIDAAVKFEEDRRFRQLKWIVVVAGFIGVGTLGTVATHYVDKAIEAKSGQLTDQARLFRLLAMVNGMEEGGGLTEEQIRTTIPMLERIAKNDELRNSPEVGLAVAQLFWELTTIDDASAVDRVFDLFRAQVLASDKGIQGALHHYGQAINASMPNSKASASAEDLQRFEDAERVAPSRHMEELALAYRTLHEFTVAGDRLAPAVLHAMQRAATLRSDADRVRYWHELVLRCEAKNWQPRPRPQALEFQRRARAFFGALAEAGWLDERTTAAVRAAAEDGLDREESEGLAEHLGEAIRTMPLAGALHAARAAAPAHGSTAGPKHAGATRSF
jgi:hypothetical protein